MSPCGVSDRRSVAIGGLVVYLQSALQLVALVGIRGGAGMQRETGVAGGLAGQLGNFSGRTKKGLREAALIRW